MSLFKLPVTNAPQLFEIALNGIEYILTCRYNSAPEGGWLLDIADAVTNLPIASNIPFVTGVDMLDGLEYLGIGGQLYAFTDGNQLAVPTLENLGVESFLYFQTAG